jgi:hypothetical protein
MRTAFYAMRLMTATLRYNLFVRMLECWSAMENIRPANASIRRTITSCVRLGRTGFAREEFYLKPNSSCFLPSL